MPSQVNFTFGFEHDTTQHTEIIRSAAAQEVGESKKQIQPFNISFILERGHLLDNPGKLHGWLGIAGWSVCVSVSGICTHIEQSSLSGLGGAEILAM